MENRNLPGAASIHWLDRLKAIGVPARHEGIGNALRAAFDRGSYNIPEDMERLLGRLNG